MKLNPIYGLRQSRLFRQLPEQDLHKIAAKAKVREYFPEDNIVWQGNLSDSVFLIVNGIVAIKRFAGNQSPQVLAYLSSGSTFGEVGILENQPRSATVSAVTEVDVLVFRRADFMDILLQYPVVAVELARTLARYLTDANKKIGAGVNQARIILLLDTFGSLGATTIGMLLAGALKSTTGRNTVYTEYPLPHKFYNQLRLDPEKRIFKHHLGYDLLLSDDPSALPDATRATLLVDKLASSYENVVITINNSLDEDNDWNLDADISIMLNNVRQIIMLVPDEPCTSAEVQKTLAQLRKHLKRDEVHIFTLINRYQGGAETANSYMSAQADFHVPYMENLPDFESLLVGVGLIPEPLANIFSQIIDRLERSHNIGVYLPTTIGVDQAADTSAWLQGTLSFMAARFGGATSRKADGMWNSIQYGMVGETVFIVNSYTTQADLNRHLDDVINFVKTLKEELKQEAMAIEINKKLTLI